MLDRVFMAVLDMSKTASLVIAVVLLARLFLRRTPKIFSYLIWAVVLFRLLCPVAFETPVSLVPQLPETSGGYILADEPINLVGAGTAAYQAIGDALNGGLGIQHVATTEKSEDGMTRYVSTDWWSVWILFGKYVWVAGMAAMLLYSVISYVKIRRKICIAVPLRENILMADDISSPFVIGFIKPKIYLPCNLDTQEQEYIILHEQYHIRRMDHIVKGLAFLALTVHWFNPLVWLAFTLACKDMEMSCDEAVIRKLGSHVRGAYSASLLTLATGHRIIAGTPLAFGEGDTKGRIRNLAKWKKPARWVLLIAMILCVALGICLVTDRAVRHSRHVGTTYYFGYVTEQNTKNANPYIGVRCNDGTEKVFYYEAGDEDVPDELVGKHVRVMARLQEISGRLFTAQVKPVTDARFENLDRAIAQAILNQYDDGYEQAAMKCASFYTYTSEISSPAGSGKTQTVTEYGIAFRQDYSIEDGRLVEKGGSNVPTVLTFRVEDGQYLLAEYWEPRDGSYYVEDINAKYPAFVRPDTEKTLLQQKIAVFRQLTDGYKVSQKQIIQHIIEDICIRQQWCNTLADLPLMCDLQFQLLKYYGADTLRYCLTALAQENPDGTQEELREKVMAYACNDILKSMGEKNIVNWSWEKTGREWFDTLVQSVPDWQRFLTVAYAERLSFAQVFLEGSNADITKIDLHNGHNGQHTLITDPEDIRAIMDFVAQVSGDNARSSKGYYGWTYSLDFMAEENTVTSIAFGDDDTFNYGEYPDGYPCRYTLRGITMQDMVSFLCQFDQSGYPWEEKYLSGEYGWSISLLVKDVTPTGLTLICRHSGGKPTGMLMTGSPYFLQRYENGAWVTLDVPQNTVWTLEALLIPQDGALQGSVDWEHIYGSLAPGKYRIGKQITDFRGTADSDTATFYAQFHIPD
ncbi:MAG: hypothetical protein IJO31_00830 [Oscillospiraceae bacterium]|nr:hypothetical protein [Oscillospiraceae bacterium]